MEKTILFSRFISEHPRDFNVQVERSCPIYPAYPTWFYGFVFPKLELTGPRRFNIKTGVQRRFYCGQRRRVGVQGQIIFSYLKEKNEFVHHLSILDLWEIQNHGPATFHELFCADRPNAVFAWKSIAQDRFGKLAVPYLSMYSAQVRLNWWFLDLLWHGFNPALVFKQKQAA